VGREEKLLPISLIPFEAVLVLNIAIMFTSYLCLSALLPFLPDVAMVRVISGPAAWKETVCENEEGREEEGCFSRGR
jgi:hypothetical protein